MANLPSDGDLHLFEQALEIIRIINLHLFTNLWGIFTNKSSGKMSFGVFA